MRRAPAACPKSGNQGGLPRGGGNSVASLKSREDYSLQEGHLACRIMGGEEPSLEGLGQERKGLRPYVQHELQRTGSQMRGSRLSPTVSHALFQTPQEAAVRRAFPYPPTTPTHAQLSVHGGTKFS